LSKPVGGQGFPTGFSIFPVDGFTVYEFLRKGFPVDGFTVYEFVKKGKQLAMDSGETTDGESNEFRPNIQKLPDEYACQHPSIA
jgi:hypothetical protein